MGISATADLNSDCGPTSQRIPSNLEKEERTIMDDGPHTTTPSPPVRILNGPDFGSSFSPSTPPLQQPLPLPAQHPPHDGTFSADVEQQPDLIGPGISTIDSGFCAPQQVGRSSSESISLFSSIFSSSSAISRSLPSAGPVQHSSSSLIQIPSPPLLTSPQ